MRSDSWCMSAPPSCRLVLSRISRILRVSPSRRSKKAVMARFLRVAGYGQLNAYGSVHCRSRKRMKCGGRRATHSAEIHDKSFMKHTARICTSASFTRIHNAGDGQSCCVTGRSGNVGGGSYRFGSSSCASRRETGILLRRRVSHSSQTFKIDASMSKFRFPSPRPWVCYLLCGHGQKSLSVDDAFVQVFERPAGFITLVTNAQLRIMQGDELPYEVAALGRTHSLPLSLSPSVPLSLSPSLPPSPSFTRSLSFPPIPPCSLFPPLLPPSQRNHHP